MELAIQRKNGALYDLKDYGITTLDLQVAAPSPRDDSEEIEGMDGVLEPEETTYHPRPLRASFYYKAIDGIDFILLRNEIFRMFSSKEAYYLIDSREPGKRWLVRSNGFPIDQLIASVGRFDVDFTAPKAYSESIGTSLDPKTFDAELWQIGQGLIADGLEYSFLSSSFRVYNPGDKDINPRNTPLVITFKGASTNLKITNTTTGDEWAYTGTTASGDTIKLDGIRSTKNNLSIFRNTNHNVIQLQEGWNDFIITGASGAFTIDFDFRFYYL